MVADERDVVVGVVLVGLQWRSQREEEGWLVVEEKG